MEKTINARLVLVAGALGTLLALPAATADVFTWDGGGTDDNWSTKENWVTVAAAPPSDGSADLRFAGSTRPTPVVDINNPWRINSLQYNTNVANFTISGNAIDIDSAISGIAINMQSGTGSQIINSNINFSGSGQGIKLTGGGGLTVGGTLTATNGALTVKGLASGLSTFVVATTGSVDIADLTVSNDGTSTARNTVLQLNDNTSLLDAMTLRLVETATGFSKVNLNFASSSETIASLFINDTQQAAGTWGATGSGATYIDDTHFTGTGTLTVVPEPAALALLLLGGVGLLRRRGPAVQAVLAGRKTARRASSEPRV
jgi:hypothetical protein